MSIRYIDSKNTIKVRKRGRISDTWTYDRVTGDIQYTEIYGDNCRDESHKFDLKWVLRAIL